MSWKVEELEEKLEVWREAFPVVETLCAVGRHDYILKVMTKFVHCYNCLFNVCCSPVAAVKVADQPITAVALLSSHTIVFATGDHHVSYAIPLLILFSYVTNCRCVFMIHPRVNCSMTSSSHTQCWHWMCGMRNTFLWAVLLSSSLRWRQTVKKKQNGCGGLLWWIPRTQAN